MKKPNEIFKTGVLNFQTDSEYRKYGKYHFSDLQSIYLGEPWRLDPEKKEENSERIGNLPAVIGGNAFEAYQENVLRLNEFKTRGDFAPSATMLELSMKIVKENIDPNNIQHVANMIKDNGYWAGSLKTDAAINKKAILGADVKGFIQQEKNFAKVDPQKVITSQQRTGIIESSIVLKKKYAAIEPNVDDIVFDARDIALEWDGFVIKLDRVIVYKDFARGGDLFCRILDYKFRAKTAENWHGLAYWSKGYWLQGLIYSTVVKNILADDITFDGFLFVIGSTTHPESSNIVRHLEETNKLWEKNMVYESGTKIPSILELCLTLDYHRGVNDFSMPYEQLINQGIITPRLPRLIQ